MLDSPNNMWEALVISDVGTDIYPNIQNTEKKERSGVVVRA